MHIDGKIDPDSYHLKLDEYKQIQSDAKLELESYNGNEKEKVSAAQEALALTREAKQLFMSSNLDEKQQILEFFFSNLQLDHENLVLEVREPFKTIATVQDQHVWRGLVDAFLNGKIHFGFCLELIQTTFAQIKDTQTLVA